MKKILSYILITLILSVNFLAPISVGFNKNNIEIKKNIAQAAVLPVQIQAKAESTNNSIKITTTVLWERNNATTYGELVTVSLKDLTGVVIDKKDLTKSDKTLVDSPNGNNIQQGIATFSGLKENTEYNVSIFAAQGTLDLSNPPLYFTPTVSGKLDPDPLPVRTQTAAVTTLVPAGSTKTLVENKTETMPACSVMPGSSGTVMGCVAQGFYYIFFVPTSYLFALAGTFFDNTFAYSVQDTSYKSAFVVQGWGLIRDFCNMFFIFIMLYVAIGTILSLHSMKTKETIVNIVIIGLFINFSLFTTQLIIDASNITARVFYNSSAIKITSKENAGASSVIATADSSGVLPLSAALVTKINPQNLILNAGQVSSSQTKGGGTDQALGADASNMGVGTFILIVIMASAVNIVGFTVFLTIGILFIARVIGLWLAMILSPLAFFTYILPEMSGIKMIGWKNWWPETLKMAFLAPVFIFFLYIILKFLETDLISDPSSKTGLAFFVATIIPFVFIMILMTKAKKIATDMSGEFGEIVTKAGSAVGGLALGAATGGAAFAMRGTIGALGDKVANSDWAKTHGRLGNMVQDAGKWTASKSFDVRKTAFGTMAGKEMGVDMGKATEGGYAKHKTEITEKRRARAESKKLGNMSEPVQTLHKAEEDEANLKNTAKNDTDRIDGTLIAKKRVEGSLFQALQSANTKLAKAEKEVETLNNNPNATQTQKDTAKANVEKEANAQKEAQDAFDENAKIIKDNEVERKELNSGTGRHADKTADGKVNKLAYDEIEKSVADTKQVLEQLKLNSPNDTVAINLAEKKAEYAEKLFKETDAKLGKNADGSRDFSATTKIKNALGEEEEVVKSLDGLALKIKPYLHHHVEKINAERLNEYATEIRGRWFSNKEANDIAAHEAIMRSEIKKH